MNNTTIARTGARTGARTKARTTAFAAPVVAAGILIGTLIAGGSAVAGAQPVTNDQCTTMTMPAQSGPNPSALTRAGQINGASAPDTSMTVNCQPASHG